MVIMWVSQSASLSSKSEGNHNQGKQWDRKIHVSMCIM